MREASGALEEEINRLAGHYTIQQSVFTQWQLGGRAVREAGPCR
jgi:hypothetical protein